jgi:hypothetical protein
MAGVIVGSTDCTRVQSVLIVYPLLLLDNVVNIKERDPIVGNSSFTYSFGTWNILGIVKSQGLSCHVLYNQMLRSKSRKSPNIKIFLFSSIEHISPTNCVSC